jgi:hypothetical protein
MIRTDIDMVEQLVVPVQNVRRFICAAGVLHNDLDVVTELRT